MKSMRKLLATLIAVMLFVLAAPAVFADDTQSEPAVQEQVVREDKADEPKAEKRDEESKAEASKAEEVKAEESKTEETIATEVTEQETQDVTAQPESASEATQEPETIQEPEVSVPAAERSIQVVASNSSLKVGETLKLTAKLSGFDGIEYTLNWQVKAQDGEWKNLSGAHGETLKVELTSENIGSAWRVTVETAD